jgi:hypothetical protein
MIDCSHCSQPLPRTGNNQIRREIKRCSHCSHCSHAVYRGSWIWVQSLPHALRETSRNTQNTGITASTLGQPPTCSDRAPEVHADLHSSAIAHVNGQQSPADLLAFRSDNGSYRGASAQCVSDKRDLPLPSLLTVGCPLRRSVRPRERETQTRCGPLKRLESSRRRTHPPPSAVPACTNVMSRSKEYSHEPT